LKYDFMSQILKLKGQIFVPALDKNDKHRDRTPHEIVWVDNMAPIYVVLITVVSSFYCLLQLTGHAVRVSQATSSVRPHFVLDYKSQSQFFFFPPL
jgi:hypothetical protein